MTKQLEGSGRDEIYVRSARVAEDWYMDLLDLRIVDYEPGWTTFVVGSPAHTRDVVLIQAHETAPVLHREKVGHGRITRELGDSDSFWAFYERIRAKQVVIERIADHGDAVALCLRDPDGNGVEIFYRYRSHDEDAAGEAESCGKPAPNDGLVSGMTVDIDSVRYFRLRRRAAA